jgi:hypothetical protein
MLAHKVGSAAANATSPASATALDFISASGLR